MKYPILVLAVLSLSACGRNDSDAQASVKAYFDKQESNEALLLARINQLDGQVAQLRAMQEQTYERYKVLKDQKRDRVQFAQLTSEDKGYSFATNEYGSFPIVMDDAQPYLDGHKVTFRIGNLTGATLQDVSLTIVYGPRFPEPMQSEKIATTMLADSTDKWIKALEYAQNNQKTIVRKISDLTELKWTLIEVIIAPSKPEDLGQLQVGVAVGKISLRK